MMTPLDSHRITAGHLLQSNDPLKYVGTGSTTPNRADKTNFIRGKNNVCRLQHEKSVRFPVLRNFEDQSAAQMRPILQSMAHDVRSGRNHIVGIVSNILRHANARDGVH